MNERQIRQVESQLPAGERLVKIYLAIEGDIRVISRDGMRTERRYTVRFDEDNNATIIPF